MVIAFGLALSLVTPYTAFAQGVVTDGDEVPIYVKAYDTGSGIEQL